MLVVGFTTVATTGRLDLISIALVLPALLLKLSSYVRGVDTSLSPRAVTRLAIGYVPFLLFDFLILAPGPGGLDRLLQAAVHLVLFTAVVKAFSTRSRRDYGYLASLSFLMMLAGAILTVSAAYLVEFLVYVLCAVSTFISYEIKRAADASSLPRQVDDGKLAFDQGKGSANKLSVPSSGSAISGSPGFHSSLLRSAQDHRRASLEKGLAGATALLTAGIVGLSAVLFFALPRYRTGYMGEFGSRAENITGFSENVDLGDIRKIKQSSLVVMRVVPEGGSRDLLGLKWRGVALTSFDGRSWRNDNRQRISLLPGAPEQFPLPRPEDSREVPQGEATRLARYRVVLAPISTDVLFAAAAARELRGRLRLIAIDETGSLYDQQPRGGPVSYEVVSEIRTPQPPALRAAPGEVPPAIRQVYLSLPPMDSRVSDLARRVTAGAHNDYDRAAAVQSYLRDNFGYTLDPSGIDPSNPIPSFLFVARKGYCEYFASAMTVMLRSLGIPARPVNGFQTGAYNPVGGDFIVRARDAHSWVEVYFSRYGWVPFDPTPSGPDPAGGWWSALGNYLDAADLFWNEWVINFDFAHQFRLAMEVERGSRSYQQAMSLRLDRFERRGAHAALVAEEWLVGHKLLVLVLMLAMLAAMAAAEHFPSLAELRFAWTWRRRSRTAAFVTGRPDAILVYRRFLKAVAKRGFSPLPAQTPREFALALGGTSLAVAAVEFVAAYNALRFGGAPVAIERLQRLLDEIRRA